MSETELALGLIAISGVAATIIIALAWAVTSALRSKSGKVLDQIKAAKGKKQLIVTATPGHTAHLFKAAQFTPGTLETAKFSERERKNRKVFYEPEKTEIKLRLEDINTDGLDEGEKEQALALTQECLNNMLKASTEKVFLEEGLPLTIAIEDKVITTGVKGIGALAFYEKLHKIKDLKEKISKLKEDTVFKEVGEYLQNLASQISLINIDVLRNYFDSDWDQTDDESQKEYYYTMGFRDGKSSNPKGGMDKVMVYGAIAIGVAGIIGGAVLAFIGKG